jgi:Enoyl-CoA hydratase/isomerase
MLPLLQCCHHRLESSGHHCHLSIESRQGSRDRLTMVEEPCCRQESFRAVEGRSPRTEAWTHIAFPMKFYLRTRVTKHSVTIILIVPCHIYNHRVAAHTIPVPRRRCCARKNRNTIMASLLWRRTRMSSSSLVMANQSLSRLPPPDVHTRTFYSPPRGGMRPPRFVGLECSRFVSSKQDKDNNNDDDPSSKATTTQPPASSDNKSSSSSPSNSTHLKEPRVETSISSDGICHVVLNRPDKLNALDLAMFEAIAETASQLRHDKSIRVVILRGHGRAFCTGLDVVSIIPAYHKNGQPSMHPHREKLAILEQSESPSYVSNTWGYNQSSNGTEILDCHFWERHRVHD